MNQKRIFGIIAVLWTLAVGAGVLVYACFFVRNAEFTQESDALAIGTRTYVSDNGTGSGMLYAIDGSGETEYIFTCKGKRYVDGWMVTALAAKEQDGVESGDFYAVLSRVRAVDNQMLFRLGRFSDKAKLLALTPSYMTGSGYEVSGFSVWEDACDVTVIHGNGKEISIYEIEEGSFVTLASASQQDKEKLAGDPAAVNAMRREHATGSDSFAEAEYVLGELYTRLNGAEAGEYFAEETAAKELFDNRSMGIRMKLIVSGVSWIAVALIAVIGIIVLGLLVFLLPMRRRVVYRIVLTEVLLLLSSLFLIFGGTGYLMNLDRQRVLGAGAYALSIARDFGDWSADDPTGILSAVAEQSGQVADVVDVCLVDTATNGIVADLVSRQGYSIDYVYGRAAGDVTGIEGQAVLSGAAEGMVRYAVSGGQFNSGRRLITVLEVPDYITYMRVDSSRVLLAGILFFAILSALEVLLALAEDRDIARLSNALSALVGEDFEFQKPAHVFGRDIRRMWSSIHEIEKYIGRESRIRFLTYQAYFRFAPKSIERILKKDSITEVRSGDAIRMVGTLAFISTEPQQGDDRLQLNRRNAFLQLVEKHRETCQGIHVQGDANLSTMRVLFLENAHSSVRFGTDLLSEMATQEEEMRMSQASVLLHHALFVYGVVGNDTQASVFLSAPEAEQLQGYAEWFRRMGLGVVMTDSVRRRESNLGSLRHIGFVRIDGKEGGRRVELYEALDSEEFSLRQGKLRHLSDFEDALSMFYARDFYFARSAFTEILRDVPQDAVAKWYLFECERLLNEEADDTFAGELHL